MRRNSFLAFLKEKSFIIVLTLMLVSAGTMAALFAFGGNEQAEQEQVAKQSRDQYIFACRNGNMRGDSKPQRIRHRIPPLCKKVLGQSFARLQRRD